MMHGQKYIKLCNPCLRPSANTVRSFRTVSNHSCA